MTNDWLLTVQNIDKNITQVMNFILFFIEWKLEILSIIKAHGCLFLL
jgi:hypothetical protein